VITIQESTNIRNKYNAVSFTLGSGNGWKTESYSKGPSLIIGYNRRSYSQLESGMHRASATEISL